MKLLIQTGTEWFKVLLLLVALEAQELCNMSKFRRNANGQILSRNILLQAQCHDVLHVKVVQLLQCPENIELYNILDHVTVSLPPAEIG
jgi:hypothetical protein